MGAYELKEKKKETSNFLPFIQEYRKKIEDELTATCQNVLTSIDAHLLKRAEDTEAKVFYYEVLNDHETACKIAKETLDSADKELANVNDENDEYQDAISIINL